MGKLIYANMMSLDGFIEDAAGDFAWAMPSEEVHSFFNDLLRDAVVEIYGRGLYETMAVWETMDVSEFPAAMAEFAEIWRGHDKIVISRTLEAVTTSRTTLLREFDADWLAALKERTQGTISIGGPGLAAGAFAAGLIDEVNLTVVPVSVGAGKRALPSELQLELELIDERRFASGFVNLSYAVRG